MRARRISLAVGLVALAVVGGVWLLKRRSGEDGPKVARRTVAILKFATHPALDATEQGIVERLVEARRTNPKLAGLVLEQRNANGNPQIAKQLAEGVSRPGVELIVAIATPAAQAVARTPSQIPLVYGAVADPEGAGILASGRATGIRNAGPNIIETAVRFIRAAFPDKSRLGTLYNPAEQNSVYVQRILADVAPKQGFQLVAREVRDGTQVSAATELLTQEVDVIYSANDNTVNTAVASVVAVTTRKGIPFILGDLSTLEAGALAAVGLEYRGMGRQVGDLVLQILGGRPITEFPPQPAPNPEVWVNVRILAQLGIQLPPAATQRVNKFVK